MRWNSFSCDDPFRSPHCRGYVKSSVLTDILICCETLPWPLKDQGVCALQLLFGEGYRTRLWHKGRVDFVDLGLFSLGCDQCETLWQDTFAMMEMFLTDVCGHTGDGGCGIFEGRATVWLIMFLYISHPSSPLS